MKVGIIGRRPLSGKERLQCAARATGVCADSPIGVGPFASRQMSLAKRQAAQASTEIRFIASVVESPNAGAGSALRFTNHNPSFSTRRLS
jgi:hypothetical protein